MSMGSAGGAYVPSSAGNAQTITSPTIVNPTITGATITSPVITSPTGVVASEIVTAANVIAAAESGTTYFLNASTEFVSTLPAPAQGLRFTFIVTAAPSGASYTIVTASSANIIKGQQYPASGAA